MARNRNQQDAPPPIQPPPIHFHSWVEKVFTAITIGIGAMLIWSIDKTDSRLEKIMDLFVEQNKHLATLAGQVTSHEKRLDIHKDEIHMLQQRTGIRGSDNK